MKLGLAREAEGATQDIIPVVRFGEDFAVLREGMVVMALDIVGPDLEFSSERRQESALAAWQNTLATIGQEINVSHHLVVDERASYAAERYFAERSRALEGRLAVVAREWARHLTHYRMVRARSLLVCSREVPYDISDSADPRIDVEAAVVRSKTHDICTSLQRQKWEARRLEAAELEQAVREVFDPFGKRNQ